MDLLQKMKDTRFWFLQVSPDSLPNIQGDFFNKGMNELEATIADLERRARDVEWTDNKDWTETENVRV